MSGATLADMARHELAVLFLFSGPPSDRALAGWLSPLAGYPTPGDLADRGWVLTDLIGKDE